MGKYVITKTFYFESAHNLTSYHGKCEELHGHNYRLEISVTGQVNEEGMVIDFKELKSIVKKKIISVLDHKYLNNIFDFSPTSENILKWIYDNIKEDIDNNQRHISKLALYETRNNKAELIIDN